MPLVIDCDPGVDDAIAILLALASPEVELLALTTVAGNLPLETTTRNALRVLALAGLNVTDHVTPKEAQNGRPTLTLCGRQPGPRAP